MKVTSIPQENNADLYIAAKQISQELIVAKDISITDQLIYHDEKDKESILLLDEERIVKKPGFEIFAFDVDGLYFQEKNDLIYMIIERENQKYTFLIGTR